TVREIISEPMEIHGLYKSNKDRLEKVYELLEEVGLMRDHANRYPHEFSGGQRQRIGIARALALDPDFIIADEPISALDVSVQAQVVNLLKDLQEEKGLTFLFIAHDLSMVKQISDRIGVMYLGNLVELTTSDRLYENPLHPYTRALLSAIPIPDPDVEESRERIILEGELPSPIDPPSGCVFRTRCPLAMDVCAEKRPVWQEASKNNYVACHLEEEESRKQIILEGEIPSPIDPPSVCVFRTHCPLAMDVCAEKRPVWQEASKNHYVACHLYDETIEEPHDKHPKVSISGK